jgi:hypothetical protein
MAIPHTSMATNSSISLPLTPDHDPFPKKRKSHITYSAHRKRQSRSARAATVDDEMEDRRLHEEEDGSMGHDAEDDGEDEEDDPLLLSPMTPLMVDGRIEVSVGSSSPTYRHNLIDYYP